MIQTEEPLYSSQKDEERPQIGQRIIPEPEELDISIKEPVIKNEVTEIDPALVFGESTQPVTTVEAISLPVAKRISILDRIVLTIYQLLY